MILYENIDRVLQWLKVTQLLKNCYQISIQVIFELWMPTIAYHNVTKCTNVKYSFCHRGEESMISYD